MNTPKKLFIALAFGRLNRRESGSNRLTLEVFPQIMLPDMVDVAIIYWKKNMTHPNRR